MEIVRGIGDSSSRAYNTQLDSTNKDLLNDDSQKYPGEFFECHNLDSIILHTKQDNSLESMRPRQPVGGDEQELHVQEFLVTSVHGCSER